MYQFHKLFDRENQGLKMIFTAVDTHKIVYSDPIIVNKGDTLQIGREDDEWRGWYFCTVVDNTLKQGWVPIQIIQFLNKNEGIAQTFYSAQELEVSKGEQFEMLQELNGWIWAKRLTDQAEGWIPLKILKAEK